MILQHASHICEGMKEHHTYSSHVYVTHKIGRTIR